MSRDLTDWNRGMGDAESGSLAASGGSRDYYDGYDYACAVDYEFVAVLPEFLADGALSPFSRDSAMLAASASAFTAQLDRLNSRLLDCEAVNLPADANLPADTGPDVVCAARC